MSHEPALPALRGAALLRDPGLNKGTAFSAAERELLGLRGLLPPRVLSIDEQVARVLANFRRLDDDLARYVLLCALQDRNETLFYRILVEHLDEMMPVIYTPTVGRACQQFGQIFRRPRGLYLSAEDRGQMLRVMRNWPHPEAAVIVVTDGERILGLGDLGAHGMGIPIGKLALYTAAAGVAPELCVPVMLDTGTDNPELLADPLYLGLRRPRLRGAGYDALVDEFVDAANQCFPGVLVQFEDFAHAQAFALLARWRERTCCFNDDIQGTAAVAVAGVFSALRATGGELAEQTVLFLGAGEAATGICGLLVHALVERGLSESAARARLWLVDSQGLVTADRAGLAEHKRPYAHPHPPAASLLDAVRALRPGVLIGVSAQPGAFTQEVIATLAQQHARPIVFALSNPTSRSECSAAQAYAWSEGRALFASGSPFAPVEHEGRVHVPRQGNNAYVFPGIGLGVTAARARRIPDAMFMAAARTLAAAVDAADLAQGSLYPPLARVREVSARIGVAVAQLAFDQGLAGVPRPPDLPAYVRARMYEPRYVDYAGG